MKILIIFCTLFSIASYAQFPTPEELELVEAEDEHLTLKEKQIEATDLVKNGPAVICSITSPGSTKQVTLQQNDCNEVIETIRQDFCVKWPKAAYSIKQENCNLKNWEIVSNTCKQINVLGVGFCQ